MSIPKRGPSSRWLPNVAAGWARVCRRLQPFSIFGSQFVFSVEPISVVKTVRMTASRELLEGPFGDFLARDLNFGGGYRCRGLDLASARRRCLGGGPRGVSCHEKNLLVAQVA